MTTLSEQLYGCLDGSKGNLLHDDVGAQLVAGRGIFLDENDNDNNDPFSSCLMEMDLTSSSSITDDLMIEDYARVPSPSSSSFVYSFTSPPQDHHYNFNIKQEEEEGDEEVLERSSAQMNAWTMLPACFQEQLLTHYGLYLKEIQQVLDMQQMDFQSDTSSLSSSLASLSSSLSSPPSVTSSPISSSPASPAVAQVPKMEKKKKSTMSFKVDHYKLQSLAKRQKREECEPLSPTEDNLYNSNDNDNLCNSTNIPSPSSPSPRSLITVAEELASAFLPSVSQIEEGIRAGTSSASAATTVIELTKRPELLTLKQSEAARIMGISTSVLSKRWREATRGKKWPHRIHHKLKRAAIC